MILTGPFSIFNVWSNDAHALAVIVSGLILPFLAFGVFPTLLKSVRGNFSNPGITGFVKKLLSIRIFILFNLIVLGHIVAAVGIGQIIIPIHIVDAAVRAVGTFLFAGGSILFAVYAHLHGDKKDEKSGFYRVIRHPYEMLLLMITLGMSLSTVSVASLFLTLFVLVPLISVSIYKDEKRVLAEDESYIEYKTVVPKFFPDVKKYILTNVFGKEDDA